MADYLRTSPPGKRRRRRVSRQRDVSLGGSSPIDVRIGNRHSPGYFQSLRVSGARDAGLFARMVDNEVRSNPKDPVLIAVNGYQPWLVDIFQTCIDGHWSDPSTTNREVQYADTVQFPQRSSKRTKWVPWSFIVDEMNVPEVYYWTFGMDPPQEEKMSDVDSYRMRIGVWTCGRGAYKFDDRISVTILFTQPTDISENIMTSLLFPHFYKDSEYDMPRLDEEGVCWVFLHLYELLTDWQNVIRDLERRLDESEVNSRGRNLPVKLRTRTMHREVDRIYELTEYLRFHTRSFKKLSKLKDAVPKNEQTDPVWDEMDDAADDLEQYSYYLDSLKERFNNLIELEFNIENANQSENSRFLSVVATLFLPVSFLASIFGITTFTASPLLYLYIAIPLAVTSVAFTILFPVLVRRWQTIAYPLQREHVVLQSRNFTMLGEELPDSADAPRQIRPQKKRSTREKDGRARGRSQSRSRSRMSARTRDG